MALFTPLAIKIGAQPWVPKFNQQMVAFDRFLHRVSKGRWSTLRLIGLPGLMLTAPGRKSGVEHSVPLLCVPGPEGYLVAGSFWGGPKQPAWVANIEAVEAAGGTVLVGFDGVDRRCTVHRLSGEEREAGWKAMVAVWPNYEKYQARTERTIKLFRLRPVPSPV